MQIQVQGECEYGASFSPEGRLLWRAHVPRWGESFTQMRPSEILARTNVEQIFGVMHQDGLPSMRFAQREGCFLFPTTLRGVLVFDSVIRVASLPRPASHLSHTIFVHHLCQPPSFTHHLSHTISHTPSLSTIFVNHHLSHTISHTHLCQPPSFTHHVGQPPCVAGVAHIHLRFAWQAWRSWHWVARLGPF